MASPQGFHDVLFPTNIGARSVGGKGWRTVIEESSGGHELRNRQWSQMRGLWEVQYGLTTLALIRSLEHFHAARNGAAFTFRFLDPIDHRHDDGIGNQPDTQHNPSFYDVNGDVIFYTATGGESEVQLTKPYGDTALTVYRKITKPVDVASYPTLVLQNGVTITIPTFALSIDTGGGPTALTNGTEYVMDYNDGLIHFDQGISPNGNLTTGDVLAFRGWFHVHGRFNSDLPRFESLSGYDDNDMLDAHIWPSIEIVESRG